jgi:translation initiation factor 4G
MEGPDGWAVLNVAAPRVSPKAAHLSQFGKVNKPFAGAPMTFGPSSVFNKKDTSKCELASLSRASSVNAFRLLSQNPEIVPEVASPSFGKSSRVPSCKPSVDLRPTGAPELPTRHKLNLLPRNKPVGTISPEGIAFPLADGDEEEAKGGMSEADAKRACEQEGLMRC